MKRQTEEKYEQAKIEKLIRYLRLYSEKGQPIDYEILIDNFKAVRRTNDPENFLMFKNFITADTRFIQVLLFSGSSNNNEKRIFYFAEAPSENDNKVSSTNSEKSVNEPISRNQLFSHLQEENALLRKQIFDLEKKTEELETRQLWFNTLLKDVSNGIVERFLTTK